MIRIQLDLPEPRVRELDSLMRKAQITTRKDLFNSALTLLAWALSERDKGRIIASLDEDTGGYKELVMPFFSFVNQNEEKDINNQRDRSEIAGRSSNGTRPSASGAEAGKGALGRAKGKTTGVMSSATLIKGRR